MGGIFSQWEGFFPKIPNGQDFLRKSLSLFGPSGESPSRFCSPESRKAPRRCIA